MKHLILCLVFFLSFSAGPTTAQSVDERIAKLDQRVSDVERKVEELSSVGLVLLLFGAFCALWAQNTGRSAWLWFFFGLFLSLFAVLALLMKNSNDRKWRLAQVPS